MVCLVYAIFWAARSTDAEHAVIIINHSKINIARRLYYLIISQMVELAKKLIINYRSAVKAKFFECFVVCGDGNAHIQSKIARIICKFSINCLAYSIAC